MRLMCWWILALLIVGPFVWAGWRPALFLICTWWEKR